MALVSTAKMTELLNQFQSWKYDDDDSDDANYTAGAISALKFALSKAESERLKTVVDALNHFYLTFHSYGDDSVDANAYGYESTLQWCLNHVTRRPRTIEQIQADPICTHDDHEFEWTATDPTTRNYIYTCKHCGYSEQ